MAGIAAALELLIACLAASLRVSSRVRTKLGSAFCSCQSEVPGRVHQSLNCLGSRPSEDLRKSFQQSALIQLSVIPKCPSADLLALQPVLDWDIVLIVLGATQCQKTLATDSQNQ